MLAPQVQIAKSDSTSRQHATAPPVRYVCSVVTSAKSVLCAELEWNGKLFPRLRHILARHVTIVQHTVQLPHRCWLRVEIRVFRISRADVNGHRIFSLGKQPPPSALWERTGTVLGADPPGPMYDMYTPSVR